MPPARFELATNRLARKSETVDLTSWHRVRRSTSTVFSGRKRRTDAANRNRSAIGVSAKPYLFLVPSDRPEPPTPAAMIVVAA